MSVRAKFVLTEIHHRSYGNGKKLIFTAQYDTAIPEDQSFAATTPNGRLEMEVDNPAAIAKFQLGQAYYIDFNPAEAKPAG